MLLLELHGADVAERGMQAALIVNVVDEPGKLLGDVVEGLVLFDPDADQVTRKVVALGQAVKRLATQKLLSDLALKLNAVGSVSRHGLFSKSPATRSIQLCLPVRHQGPTPDPGQNRSAFEYDLRKLPVRAFQSLNGL